MSYEGYTEWKCPSGHVDAADVYESQPIACRTCGERFAKRRSIDETNGRLVLPWRAVEYRPQFKDYVGKQARKEPSHV
jgi:hypothetical protein